MALPKQLQLIMIATFAGLLATAQDNRVVTNTVTQLFIQTDKRMWPEVTTCFADMVVLDYSSMNHQPAAALSPRQIITSWKTLLPGFTQTHHQLGNFLITLDNNTATVFCYVTATHYLEDAGGNVWTVVGSYDFNLIKNAKGEWKITKMKFNFQYQDGNISLPKKAMEKAKNSAP